MFNKRIEEVQKIAHRIECRINLFDGYSPKETETHSGEIKFWRHIVNLYGLFADCDRVQIKESKNLIELMLRFGLIEREEYEFSLRFWQYISDMRKWFCHNNDNSLYYAQKRANSIKKHLEAVFCIATVKPEKIEDIQPKEWAMLSSDVERRFEQYLGILKRGLLAWDASEQKEVILGEWISMFANALYGDKELIRNVLADIAEYEKRDKGLILKVSSMLKGYYTQLEDGGFSEEDIEDTLKAMSSQIHTNQEIILISIRNSNLL